jgi:hypothetical protein
VNEACLKSRVREFMSQIVEQVGIRTFSDDESLRATGIFRPLAVFRSVAFLEAFSISIAEQEIATDRLIPHRPGHAASSEVSPS